METEIAQKKQRNYSRLASITYLYLLGYFLMSNAWFCYFASEKALNKTIFYIVAFISFFFAILCFIKANKKRGKKNKKTAIINTIIDTIASAIIIYLIIKIICISHGGPAVLI